ncbi:tRNA (guanosine(37)-N1)-methyltransferase TrmD [Rhodobacteraceae bacterium F11138]|nr:tRNA (guanosine(37)-N1)-methyltransferase TrmD [Rhodobacteraceae bacterium F11138]
MSDPIIPPEPVAAPSRAQGRKSIRPSAQPRELMTPVPDLKNVWKAQVITLLPGAFPGILGESLTGKALQDGLWQLETLDLRSFGIGKHRNVDDTPAGGGAGMVLRADVIGPAIQSAQAGAPQNRPLFYLSPRGRPMTQQMMQDLARADGVTLLCGRFEGVDQRVLDHFGMQEVSLGDFVLTGGEIAAQALIDATVRLLPGVLGNASSTEEESFSAGLLEHPQYTRPAVWNDHPIPEVLMSGHHGRIAQWRREQSENLTRIRRPDLWAAYQSGKDDDRA